MPKKVSRKPRKQTRKDREDERLAAEIRGLKDKTKKVSRKTSKKASRRKVSKKASRKASKKASRKASKKASRKVRKASRKTSKKVSRRNTSKKASRRGSKVFRIASGLPCEIFDSKSICESEVDTKGLRRCRYNFKEGGCEDLPKKYKRGATLMVGGSAKLKKYTKKPKKLSKKLLKTFQK